jgi:hypothetical protein
MNGARGETLFFFHIKLKPNREMRGPRIKIRGLVILSNLRSSFAEQYKSNSQRCFASLNMTG